MKNRITLSYIWTAVLWILLSAVSAMATLILQPGPVSMTLEYQFGFPILLLLNSLPMLILMGILFFLVRNIFYSASITTLFWGLLSYVNLLKIGGRGDAFVPGDILLLSEGIDAVGSYKLDLHLRLLGGLLGLCVLLWVIGIFIKSQKPKLTLRVLGIVLLASGFVGAMTGLYIPKKVYNSLPELNLGNVPNVFNSAGFPYAFLHNFNLYPVDKPEGYSTATAKTYEDAFRGNLEIPEVAPNIIMIMCEAFTDLPNDPAFTYSLEENPISYYNSLAARQDTISGHLIVSNTGAGTANTEFDVLTGMMTNRIGEGTTSAFRVVHRNTDSIPRALAQVGYNRFFLHPGQNWFYNRQSVYSYLGILDQAFKDSFKNQPRKGGRVSDEGFLNVLKKSIEQRDTEAPLFTYGVTIQNHQAYVKNKYTYTPEAVKTDLPLSEDAAVFLSVYFEGLRDSDTMLQGLTAYLQEQSEPYLLVFFGDHQPSLGGNYLSYRELGLYSDNMSTEEFLAMYRVPFLIWANDACQDTIDLEHFAMKLGPDPVISSHYLGALTCEVAGFQGLDGYIDYLNQLRRKLPVCSVFGYMTPDGTYLSELPPDLWEQENTRWYWQYYRLKHQDVD